MYTYVYAYCHDYTRMHSVRLSSCWAKAQPPPAIKRLSHRQKDTTCQIMMIIVIILIVVIMIVIVYIYIYIYT